MKALIIVSLGLINYQVQAQSFHSGNQFKSIPMYGTVNVRCTDMATGQISSAVFQCQDVHLVPVEYDYFTGPNVDADQVTLSSTRSNGSVISKTSGYKNGQSVNRFNLWLVSMLQQPLLKDGPNTISYKLTKNNNFVSAGAFTATVSRQKALMCNDGFLNSNNSLDCESPYSACEQYFSQSSCQ